MKVSTAAWEELRAAAGIGIRAGVETQRIIADELDRRAAGATGKRRDRLTRIAADARERANAVEAELARLTKAAM